jgi:hypothetical protein
MADTSEPNKPVRRPDWKSGKGVSAESPSPHVELPWAWRAGPWEWHITETFKGLIQLSIELVKMLALINGGALVALLAYLGNVATHSPANIHPHLRRALGYFCNGLFATIWVMIFAYLTQLRLYNEERVLAASGMSG